MAVGPRAIWRRASKSVASDVAGLVSDLLDDQGRRLQRVEEELREARSELAELRRLAAADVEVQNELARLQGRQLRSMGDRLERLEEQANPSS
jgi:hypothetical protein